jgi:hypothetical protein
VSFFHGDEGDNTGAHVSATLLRALGGSRSALRLDLLAHYFTPQPLHPCGLVLSGTCFQTSQRSVVGAAFGLEYAISRAPHTPRATGFHAATSLAAVNSRRVAEWFPNCEPGEFCPPKHLRRHVNDPTGGVLVALGWSGAIGTASVYSEASLLYPFARKYTNEDQFKEYWIFPISIGVRF